MTFVLFFGKSHLSLTPLFLLSTQNLCCANLLRGIAKDGSSTLHVKAASHSRRRSSSPLVRTSSVSFAATFLLSLWKSCLSFTPLFFLSPKYFFKEKIFWGSDLFFYKKHPPTTTWHRNVCVSIVGASIARLLKSTSFFSSLFSFLSSPRCKALLPLTHTELYGIMSP